MTEGNNNENNKKSSVGLWRTYDVDPDKIEQLRVACYDYARAHPEEIDLDDVRERIDPPEDVANNNIRLPHNWMLKRLLIAGHRDVDQALQRFISSFRFRHDYHLNHMTRKNILPKEFYQLQPLDDGGHDHDGHRILVIRLKYYKKIPQFDLLIRRAIVYFAEQHDIEYEKGICKGIVLFFDCVDFRVSQVDFDLLKFAMVHIPHHFAGLVRYIVVCDIPFLLGYVFKMVESWMPTDKSSSNGRKYIISTSRKQLHEMLSPEERAEFLGGKRHVDTEIPDDTYDLQEFMENVEDLEPQNMKKISIYVNELMQTHIYNK